MVGTHTGKLSAESVRAALRRVRGSALNFVPRDCEAEARPADETAEAEQGQRSAFCKPAATGAAKAGNRNHQGERISAARLRAEMGSPWSVAFLRHAEAPGFAAGGPSGFMARRFGVTLDQERNMSWRFTCLRGGPSESRRSDPHAFCSAGRRTTARGR